MTERFKDILTKKVEAYVKCSDIKKEKKDGEARLVDVGNREEVQARTEEGHDQREEGQARGEKGGDRNRFRGCEDDQLEGGGIG